MDTEELLASIKRGLQLFNEGSDNTEYLRGQTELAMFLLGWDNDDEDLKAQLEIKEMN